MKLIGLHLLGMSFNPFGTTAFCRIFNLHHWFFKTEIFVPLNQKNAHIEYVKGYNENLLARKIKDCEDLMLHLILITRPEWLKEYEELTPILIVKKG